MNNGLLLFKALSIKTIWGKLAWAETAGEGVFITVVRGKMTFRLKMIKKDVSLEMLDSCGLLRFQILSQAAGAKVAYHLASFNAARSQVGISEAISLLRGL